MADGIQYQKPEFVPRHLPLRELRLPGPGEAHVWFLDLVQLGSPLQPDARIDPQRFPPRMQRSLRRFYLRLMLGAYLGMPGKEIRISRAIKGKPLLDPEHHPRLLDFSIANSAGCCLVGVSSGELIGVDLEWSGRQAGNPLALARRYFSTGEAAALAQLKASGGGKEQPAACLHQAFLHTWACKEAVVKAAGHGIADQLHRFTVNVDPHAPARILAMQDDDPEAWRLAVFEPRAGHLGAITLRAPQMKLSCYSLQAGPTVA